MRWSVNGGGAYLIAHRGMQPKQSPASSVRAAAGEMMIAASRRDLCGTIACTGSDSDGPGSAEHDR